MPVGNSPVAAAAGVDIDALNQFLRSGNRVLGRIEQVLDAAEPIFGDLLLALKVMGPLLTEVVGEGLSDSFGVDIRAIPRTAAILEALRGAGFDVDKLKAHIASDALKGVISADVMTDELLALLLYPKGFAGEDDYAEAAQEMADSARAEGEDVFSAQKRRPRRAKAKGKKS